METGNPGITPNQDSPTPNPVSLVRVYPGSITGKEHFVPVIPLNYGIPPEDRNGEHIPLLSPKLGRPIQALVVNSQMACLFVHFLEERRRSVPCLGKTSGCKFCGKAPLRWKGYLGCAANVTGRKIIVEVTAEVVRKNPILINLSTDLRGYTIRLERKGSRPNSPVDCVLTPPAKKLIKPGPFDLETALNDVFKPLFEE